MLCQIILKKLTKKRCKHKSFKLCLFVKDGDEKPVLASFRISNWPQYVIKMNNSFIV
jgi:hypothetical protein